jgi:capsular polysaccharide biosynthesis protein
LDFEEDGVKHKKINVVVSPAMTDRMKETMKQIHQNTELSKRYKEIIDKKRVEWRAREVARKLVG